MRMGVYFIIIIVLSLGASVFASSEAASEEPQSLFSGSLSDAIWTVLAFVILLLVLWRLAWKPMLAGLNTRQEYIEKQISDSEETKQKAGDVLADYRAKLANVETEGKGIIKTHVNRAEKEAKEIVSSAREESEAMKLKMELDIERARSVAQSELLDEAGSIVLRLGEEVLGRSMDDEDHNRLISQAIERLRQEQSGGNGQE